MDTLDNRLPIIRGGGISQAQTIEDIAGQFLSSLDIRETSRETYGRALGQFLNWMKETGTTKPDRESLLKYKAELRDRGLSPYSVAVYIVTVRQFFRWTARMKYYPDISEGIKTAKNGRGFRKDPLTIDQIKSLLCSIGRTTLAGKRDFALLNLLIRTGLRTIEVVRADIKDIRQRGGDSLLWIHGKGRDSKDEFVVLTPDTLSPIREYLRARGIIGQDKPLFASISDRNGGERLTTRSIRRIAKDRLRGIGIDSERITAHSLRHTAITLSLQAGATVQEAQALGRHSNINTTLVYSHNLDRLKNAPERRIDKLLNGEIPVGT